MDVNETIVGAWLESKGYFLRRRLKYDLSNERNWSSASDVDLLAYNPEDNHRVAVMVTAWMTIGITPSHIKPGGRLRKTFNNFKSKWAEEAISDAFKLSDGESFDRWWVVGKLGADSKKQVQVECEKLSVSKVFEFERVFEDLIGFISQGNRWFPHESETLQVLRALHWTDHLKGTET